MDHRQEMTVPPNDVHRIALSQRAAEDLPRARLRRLAWLLDSSVRLPGGFRIGVDGIIGLIPGVGDMVAAALSCYIIVSAARMDVPASVLIRMGLNVLLDLVVGTVPVIGDVFDFVFKANERNVQLLDAHIDDSDNTQTQSRWLVAAVVTSVLLAMGLALTIVISLVGMLWSAVTT